MPQAKSTGMSSLVMKQNLRLPDIQQSIWKSQLITKYLQESQDSRDFLSVPAKQTAYCYSYIYSLQPSAVQSSLCTRFQSLLPIQRFRRFVCLSVRPSDGLKHSAIVTKRLNMSLNFFVSPRQFSQNKATKSHVIGGLEWKSECFLPRCAVNKVDQVLMTSPGSRVQSV